MNRIELPNYVISDIPKQVRAALDEDIGPGDITANLVDSGRQANASIITRESAVICGQAWANEVFAQLGDNVTLHWYVADGEKVDRQTTLCSLSGKARDILSGERSALNFLQLLSSTATQAHEYAELARHKNITILDTRKTIPGLRTAQKYAALCGGCSNHRLGLYDAFMIKENHIAAYGSIESAIHAARKYAPDKKIIVEVETLEELKEAILSQPDQIMLDDFPENHYQYAEEAIHSGIMIELSGSFSLERIASLAPLPFPVFISSGAITKNIKAIDMSLRLRNL